MSSIPAEGSTTIPPRELREEDLRGLKPIRTLAGRNRTKADVLVYRMGAREVAVKDYAARPWPLRHLIGRFLTRRESLAYAAAEGLSGLPRFLGRLGPHALATEWVDGHPLSDSPDGTVPPARFDRLEQIVRSLHERGIALADLSHRDVLLGDDGSVRVLDLAMAWRRGASRRGLRARVFEHFRQGDVFALARLRNRFSDEARRDSTGESAPSAVAWHRRARRAKWIWDRLRGAPRLPPVNDHWRW